MNVGDLVRHIYTGRCFLIAGAGLYPHSVRLVGWPTNQVFNTQHDLELLSSVLSDEQLENVIGGMSTQQFSDWRAEKLNETR